MNICEICYACEMDTQLKCGHWFCFNCIALTLYCNQRCPKCRAETERWELFVHESQRMNTFKHWNSPHVKAVDLSSNGFIHVLRFSYELILGRKLPNVINDMVWCMGCDALIGEWEPGDNVEEEHRKHPSSGKCPFLKK